jgi:hypothetical protein
LSRGKLLRTPIVLTYNPIMFHLLFVAIMTIAGGAAAVQPIVEATKSAVDHGKNAKYYYDRSKRC